MILGQNLTNLEKTTKNRENHDSIYKIKKYMYFFILGDIRPNLKISSSRDY